MAGGVCLERLGSLHDFRKIRRTWFPLLAIKHFVSGVAAADEVGGQVEDFVFGHSIEQPSRHGRSFGDDKLFNGVAIDRHPLIWIRQIRVQHDGIPISSDPQIDDHTGVNASVVGKDLHRRKLIVDDFAGIDDLI